MGPYKRRTLCPHLTVAGTSTQTLYLCNFASAITPSTTFLTCFVANPYKGIGWTNILLSHLSRQSTRGGFYVLNIYLPATLQYRDDNACTWYRLRRSPSVQRGHGLGDHFPYIRKRKSMVLLLIPCLYYRHSYVRSSSLHSAIFRLSVATIPREESSALDLCSIMSSRELNPNNLTPALPPPPGEVSNFVNPESLWKWNLLTTTLCLFLVTIAFVLRIYVRLRVKREWLLEDCKFFS